MVLYESAQATSSELRYSPLIARLRESNPQITIELVLSNRVQDLLHREADIAVRMTTPTQEQLIARRVGSIELGLHASASYIARHGSPESTEDLLKHALIGFDQHTPFIRKALTQYPQLNRDCFSMRTDSDVAQLNLIRAGAGIGICRYPLPVDISHYSGYFLISFLCILIHGSSCTKTCAIVGAANSFSMRWLRD